MTRIMLVMMTVLGLNAGNVPGTIGDALKTAGNVGSDIGGIAKTVVSKASTGGLSIGQTSNASVMGGFGNSVKPIFVSGGSFGKASPINVAKSNVRTRNKGLGGLNF